LHSSQLNSASGTSSLQTLEKTFQTHVEEIRNLQKETQQITAFLQEKIKPIENFKNSSLNISSDISKHL
jgi:Skp family chaperone for outer membrane proteins